MVINVAHSKRIPRHVIEQWLVKLDFSYNLTVLAISQVTFEHNIKVR